MIDKYIEQLLKDNKRVIIPDFGGFVVKRTASGDAISFNGFLKFNDDLLVTAVSQGQDCSKEDAMKDIAKDVEQIVLVLDGDGAYEMKGVGFLVRDKKGNVRFMSELPAELVTQGKAEKKEEQNKTEPKAIVDEKPLVVEDNDLVSSSKAPVVKSKSEGIQALLKHRLFIPALVAATIIIVFIVWLILKPEKVDSIKQSHEEIVSEMADKKLEDKEPRKGLSSFFKKKEKVEKEAVTAPVVEEEALPPVMAPLSKDIQRGVSLLADRNIAPKGKERYNIIIGSFQDLENANLLKNKLIDDGYGAQVFDRYNGWHAVSLGGFPSLDIALMVSGENISKYPDLWILVK